MGISESHQLHPGLKSLVISGDQASHLRERFELISDSFGLDREEVATLYKAKPDQLDTVFQIFDQHGRDKIDAYEFIAGMIIICDASLEVKADLLFELYDFDHSQAITFDELIILLRTSMNALCYMTGGSPMTMQELEDKTQRLFTKIDLNHDNQITIAEWLSFITRDVEVVKILEVLQLVTVEDIRPNFGSEEDPGMDSDLENETNRREWSRSTVQERVKEGVETLDDTPFLLEQVGEGDQFLAVKPWEGVVKHSVPSNYRPKKGDDDPPDANLELEYIHGYRCHDVRNNLRYSNRGEVVYHTAAVGIVLNQGTNTQKHFIAHTDDIISFDIHPQGTMAVTGEIGRTPLMCVWNTETMECVKSFKGILKKGITCVCFSADGTKVAGLGADEEKIVVVYDLGRGTGKPGLMQSVVASGSVGKDTFLDIKFHPSTPNKIVACGVKVFAVINIANGAITAKRGTGWGKTPQTQQQTLMSIGFLGASAVTGAFNGCVFKWNESTLSQAVKVHEAPVVCIGQRTGGEGIITGGNDGFIHILDLSLGKIQSIDLKDLGSILPKPRSACEGPGGKILIGTRGGEIFEVTGQNSKALLKGHYDKELWGVCSHPTRLEFATLGQECMLAVWDVPTRKQKTCKKLEGPGGALAYSPNAAVLLAGLENGKVVILDGNSLAVKDTKFDRTKCITDIKFSPNGNTVAVGAKDFLIFIYAVNENYRIKNKFKGHTASVTHIDFSVAGDIIQSNSTSYEILYHNLSSGSADPHGATAYKDEPWATWTCVLGWPVQGIWPPCSGGDDINNLERSKSHKVVATVDDFGQVKLFKNPCVNKGAGFNVYKGHSSHVTNLSFLNGYLITTGGNDKAIFQWKYTEEHIEINASDDLLEATRDETNLFDIQNVGEGDQFLAVKPWLGELKASTPNDYTPPKNQGKAPDENITLIKVHGYRSFDSRNNLKYTSTGQVVYPAAALGIVMDPASRQQKFFQMHDDDVVCLAIHPNRKIVATGQMAHIGKSRELEIHVWDSDTLQGISCLSGFHRRAIKHVGFSPDGKSLLSIGEDDDHSLAVYEWQAKRMICNSKVEKEPVLGASFISNTDLAVYGAKFIKFFTINGKNVTGNRGTLGNASKPFEAQLCGVAFNNNFVTGTHAGNIWIWAGRSLGKSMKAHNGQVWALTVVEGQLLSGGSDGVIIVWDQNMMQSQSVSIDAYALNPGVRSLDINSAGTVLVGTRSAEILEIRNWQEVESLGSGHYDGELWGLAMHPEHPLCATCGGDKTIRIWDLAQGIQLLAIKPLSHDMRAIDWSPDGRYLASGLMNGMVILLDASSLSNLSSLQSTFKGKDCWIEDLKFSPRGDRIAFGAHGGASKVEIMGIQNGKLVKMYAINAGLTSALTHLDWSIDASLVAVNSQAYELKFVNVDGKINVSSSSVKNVEWYSWTCVLGWSVQYIWPEGADGTDINSCHRSHNLSVLATADDFGKVNLFRYPVAVKKQACKSYTGHSSHVTKCKFSSNDAFLVSTGGNDKCVFVWQTDMAVPDTDPVYDEDNKIEFEDIPKEMALNKKNEEVKEKTKVKVAAALENNDPNSFFQFEELGEGDQFLAVKPWEGAIKPPSGFIKAPRNQNQAPAIDLSLEWVHGYRAKDCRNNLRYLHDGRIIYHAAGLGISLNKETWTQTYFNKHIDDIIAFALSPNCDLAATGEVGRRPNIFIWDTASMMPIANFKQPLEKGISAIAFSPSATKLVAIGMDDNHSVAIYNLQSNSLICTTNGDREIILDVGFISENEFITTGPKHYKQWTLSGNQLSGKKGVFGRNNNLLMCLAIQGTNIYTGTAIGTIIKWAGNTAGKSFPIHQRGVDSLWATHACIVSGGKDGLVYILDNNLNKRQSFDLSSPQYESVCPFIRSACISEDGGSLLVGTYGAEIYEIDITSGEGRNLIKGHYTPSRGKTVTNEVWGLHVLPDGAAYATCSDDGTLRLWDIENKSQIRIIKFTDNEEIPDSAKARCLCCNPDGSMMAVGFKDGSFKILDTSTWNVRVSKKDRKSEISDIKFSPDRSKLAIGSHDCVIDIYSVPDFRQIAVCKGHSSYITHIDWSTDSGYIHSNCGAYELLFWDGNSGRQNTSGASALKDEEWNTWTLVIGWPVQGIYPAYADGTDVNAVDRSKKKFGNNEYPLVATSDDFGMLKVFRYPCLLKGSEGVIGRGHSSHVTNVRFSVDDRYIFTAGGDDQCVFQWKVTAKTSAA
ncbi:unnamed protein product [Blepharisma stoltei]|uniref:EF-hand domain-containing protein n=1 Tax=Blepharisma stoltei TaxID=1481888 RepID=A0AAU9JNE0_9CILI|nr:unnamed protein product [Blepharisma stoltei]